MTEHPFTDELPAYAIGALSDKTRRLVEEHLEDGCPECASDLAALSETVAQLAYAVPARELPADLKDRVMSRVLGLGEDAGEGAASPRRALTPTPAPKTDAAAAPADTLPAATTPSVLSVGAPDSRSGWSALPLAAVLLLAAGAGAAWLSARSEAERLAEELSKARGEASRLDERLATQAKELEWLRDPRVQVALLRGLAGAERAKAKLLWHPETRRGILYVDGLPPLPLTKSYELWAFVGGVPRPAGVFETSVDGATVVSLSSLEGAAERPTSFAVSVEPRGGKPSPTGAVVLAGETF